MTKAFDRKDLALAIFGKVCSAPKEEGMPNSANCFQVQNHGFKHYDVYIRLSSAVESGITPAAFVRHTDDNNDVTAVVEYKTLSFFKEEKGEKVVAKDRQGIRLPVIMNKAKLTRDAEVILYREKEVTETKRSKVVNVDCGLQKKSKLARGARPWPHVKSCVQSR